MEQQQYASGCIDDMVEGGGLADDFDFTLTTVATENYDFGPTKGGKRPCLKVVFDAAGYDEPITQYYSLGKATEWVATPDGKGFKQLLAPDQKMNKNSNVGQFVMYLGNAGYPTTLLAKGDFSILTGLVGHAKRFVMTNIPDDGQKLDKLGKPKKNLYITAVQSYKDAKGKVVTAGAATTASSSNAGASTAGKSIEDETIDVICTLLKSNPSGIAKGDLPRSIFAQDKLTPLSDKAAVAKCAMDDSLLSNGPWNYDGGVVKPLA